MIKYLDQFFKNDLLACMPWICNDTYYFMLNITTHLCLNLNGVLNKFVISSLCFTIDMFTYPRPYLHAVLAYIYN